MVSQCLAEARKLGAFCRDHTNGGGREKVGSIGSLPIGKGSLTGLGARPIAKGVKEWTSSSLGSYFLNKVGLFEGFNPYSRFFLVKKA